MKSLERIIPDHLGIGHGIAASDGTPALQLGLLILDIGSGDEAVVPEYTFVAVINMVLS